MDKNNLILSIIQELWVAEPAIVGGIAAYMGMDWRGETSQRENARKVMTSLSDIGHLEKCQGFYRITGCKSEYKPHSKAITHALARIMKTPYNPIIYRECSIDNQRADAAFILRKETKLMACLLEVCIDERHHYLEKKRNEYHRTRKEVCERLSNLFNYRITDFAIIVEGKQVSWATDLNTLLKEAL